MLVMRSESEDSMSGEKRPEGYYWVRLNCSEWGPSYYTGKGFLIEGVLHRNDSISEIGPPCSHDDSKQLQKARGVLRKIARKCEAADDLASWDISDDIDESGVRL